MKGRLFQCFDAVLAHGRGAFKVASSSILETTLSKGTGDLSHAGGLRGPGLLTFEGMKQNLTVSVVLNPDLGN